MIARRKSTSQARVNYSNASLCVSLIGVVTGVMFAIFLFVVFYPRTIRPECGTIDTEMDRNRTGFWPEPTTPSPEVTPPACHVFKNRSRNGSACFRFASYFTARGCSAVGGVNVNITSSSSSPPPSLPAAASTICYHNVCNDYVINASCFQYRSALLPGAQPRGRLQRPTLSSSPLFKILGRLRDLHASPQLSIIVNSV